MLYIEIKRDSWPRNLSSTCISHEHCANLVGAQKIQYILEKLINSQIYTVFTKGQSMLRHLLQSFDSKHSLL